MLCVGCRTVDGVDIWQFIFLCQKRLYCAMDRVSLKMWKSRDHSRPVLCDPSQHQQVKLAILYIIVVCN